MRCEPSSKEWKQVGREARSEDDPIPVGGPIAPENVAPPSQSGEPAVEGEDEEGDEDDV